MQSEEKLRNSIESHVVFLRQKIADKKSELEQSNHKEIIETFIQAYENEIEHLSIILKVSR